MSQTVIKIVKQYLQDNGFTGLVDPNAPCGCSLEDLKPCGMDPSECQPGHLHMDPRPEHKGDWAVFTHKEAPTDKQWDQVEY